MTLYKVNIHNREYTSWSFYDILNYQVNNLNIEPAKHKLFSNDVFKVDDIGNIKIEHSSTRVIGSIPGVLVLKNNKTYGRQHGRLLYKCVPDDMRLPCFLVPYEMNHVGFLKVFVNMYVTFSFAEWEDKHPHGILNQVIGSVDVLDNFYEYQLYCKSLNSSIQQFHKDINKALDNTTTNHDAFIKNICSLNTTIEDRTSWHVFSIDPSNCADFDDAFSIKLLEDNTISLSIYISNVAILINALNLWSSFSNRVSTIYLPDKKRPMLPTILSDCLCSLRQGSSRIAFVLDLILDITNNYTIVSTKYSNCLINVKKNFVYEEHDLLETVQYQFLLDTTRLLSKKYKYISSVKNSHDVVCYLMILMNYYSAKELLKAKVGIFRTTIKKNDTVLLANVPEEVSKFIKIWNSSAGHYVDINSIDDLDLNHDLLELDAYIHITSPIRRLVDLLNLIKFQQVFFFTTLSSPAYEFYDNWLNQMDYINVTMRAIKKIQNDCTLLDTFSKNLVLNKLYNGYCFDKLARSDGLFQYIVYLPELKLTSRITIREDFKNYELNQYKLVLFNNEEKFKKKIRLHLCN